MSHSILPVSLAICRPSSQSVNTRAHHKRSSNLPNDRFVDISASAYPTRSPRGHLITGDFNGDGKLDIATVNSTSVTSIANNSVSILLGKGDGTFASFIDYSMGSGVVAVGRQWTSFRGLW